MSSIPVFLTAWQVGDPHDSDSAIRLEIVDKISGEMVIDVEIPSDLIVSALANQQANETVAAEIGQLHRVGKVRETRDMAFSMPHCDEKDRKTIATDIAKSLCPKGWSVDEFKISSSCFSENHNNIDAIVEVSKWRVRQPGDDDDMFSPINDREVILY